MQKNQGNLVLRSCKIVIVLCLLLITISSCKKENSELTDKDYRVKAWNYLSKNQQQTVNVKWEEAPVAKPSQENPEAISVTFGTTQDAILGPIIVYISVDTKAVLGVGGHF